MERGSITTGLLSLARLRSSLSRLESSLVSEIKGDNSLQFHFNLPTKKKKQFNLIKQNASIFQSFHYITQREFRSFISLQLFIT